MEQNYLADQYSPADLLEKCHLLLLFEVLPDVERTVQCHLVEEHNHQLLGLVGCLTEVKSILQTAKCCSCSATARR